MPVGFATALQTALVRGVETPAAAFSETVDAFGAMVWLFRDQMIAKINAALDDAADDSNALDERQRQEAEATITADMLAVQRSECSLVWNADSAGTVIDFRADSDPRAVLGIRLVTVAPRVAAPGSSADHAYDIVGR